MLSSNLFNIGIKSMPSPCASKVRISNIVIILTCLIASLYALFFLLALKNPILMIMNFSFVIAYSLSLYINHIGYYSRAKLWFFCVLMIHVLVLTTIVFTPSASFYFYYLLFPCGIFLLFEDKDKYEKRFVMLSGSVLFFYCHTYENLTPLIKLSTQTESIIFISAISVILLEIYFVMSIFSQAIDKNQKELKLLAEIDPLTSVNNRRSLMTLGEELVEYSKRYHSPLSILMLDIDRFKLINDTYGHLNGDIVIQQLASTLKNQTRASDVVARYGGEEFVVILPNTDLTSAVELAETLRKNISGLMTSLLNKEEIQWTVSIGVTSLNQAKENLSLLLNQADSALYQSKEAGRNMVSTFSPN